MSRIADIIRLSEIYELKQNLKDTDYKVLKYVEGELPEIEYNEIKKQRQAWRDRINELEQEDEELL